MTIFLKANKKDKEKTKARCKCSTIEFSDFNLKSYTIFDTDIKCRRRYLQKKEIAY